jgi:hypothetical protein
MRIKLTGRHLHRGVWLLLLACCVMACRFNPPYQGRGTDYLQGQWQQDSVAGQQMLTNYSLYNVRFSCDSFFIQMRNFTRVNYGADSCMRGGKWTEYAAGTYSQQTDTLKLKGFYCNANYSLKNPGGCYNSGVYQDDFKLKQLGNGLINLSSLNHVNSFKLRLLKRIACVPKHL